jgi:gamma-butyrobetaine dioxygenase
MTTLSHEIQCISRAEDALVITWSDGEKGMFHHIWLRDNAPEGRHPVNGQRFVDLLSYPEEVRPLSVEVDQAGQLCIVWWPDDVVSRFDPSWLRENSYSGAALAEDRWHRTLWDSTGPSDWSDAPTYDQVSNDTEALRVWISHVSEYGMALLRGVPVEPGTITKVVELFSCVHETNYGRVFDVRSVPNPSNLAFTTLALAPHTDTPYRDPEPTIQLLHCLVSSGQGGDSVLVDGFRAAKELRLRDPQMFEELVKWPVRFSWRDDETQLSAEASMIRLDAQGNVDRVRYQDSTMAPMRVPQERMLSFYRAYRTFSELITSPRFQVFLKLEPGDLIMFDNRRIVHGRTAYSEAGDRHLQGCYSDMDGLHSRLALLTKGMDSASGP